MRDLSYGLRVLIKNPAFTLIGVATLAIGIGANSAMFSVVNTVLLKPFSFRNPEQLVVLWERSLKEGLPRMVVSPPNFADWRAQNHVFQDVAAYRFQDFNAFVNGILNKCEGYVCRPRCFRCSVSNPFWGVIFSRMKISRANLPQSS
jgi:putative ABC transport system permease protein